MICCPTSTNKTHHVQIATHLNQPQKSQMNYKQRKCLFYPFLESSSTSNGHQKIEQKIAPFSSVRLEILFFVFSPNATNTEVILQVEIFRQKMRNKNYYTMRHNNMQTYFGRKRFCYLPTSLLLIHLSPSSATALPPCILSCSALA